MRELSMHILDLVMNSNRANASQISIVVDENETENSLEITVSDNGDGMTSEQIKQVSDPFYTSRTTRKVGLGIPLLASTAKRCDGMLEIDSEIEKGTHVYAKLKLNHIDCPPMGDLKETILTLITTESNIDYAFIHKVNDKSYSLDTKEIKQVLKEIPLNNFQVIDWLKEKIGEEEEILRT